MTDARLWNLAEGLSISAGVRQPRLLVVDSPALNAMAAGGRPGRAVVAVTSGLLAELERIELEAVLAERADADPPTRDGAGDRAGGHVRPRPAPGPTRGRDAQVDQAAVALTRYPPALAAALEKLEAKGAAVAGQAGYDGPSVVG